MADKFKVFLTDIDIWWFRNQIHKAYMQLFISL